MKKDSYRILGENVRRSNNTWETGINNNDLIIGPSGSGKTTGYVIPNIINSEDSLIVADTKGNLRHKIGGVMARKGYKVISLDFKEIRKSEWGYNPLNFIRKDPITKKANEQDIMTTAQALSPVCDLKDPFWERTAQEYLGCMISYVCDYLPPNERTLSSVIRLASYMGTDIFDNMMDEVIDVEPDCFIAKRFRQMCSNREAEKMEASIKGFVYKALNCFDNSGMKDFFCKRMKINFKQMSREKTIVFLNISDTDRSRDTLINLFYTQALQELCREADARIPECRLQIPVRFILDDFATNTLIPDFDNIISVIRSRDIYVSLIIQSLSQLQGLYGSASSKTIINNCDNILYLGGQDVDTAQYMSIKLNKTVFSILNLPLDSAFLFTRGSAPEKVQKTLLNGPTYREIMERNKQTDNNNKRRRVKEVEEKHT